MRQAWLALVLLTLGCASAPIKKQDAQTLVEADQQVLAGCYDCLLGARQTYERFAVAKARPLLVNRLFEVQVLIVLREIELALDWQPALARARALAKELAGAARGTGKEPPPPIDGDRVLALVDMVPPDDYGSPSRAVQTHRRDRSSRVARLVEDLAWLDTSPVAPAVRSYLRFSIECSYGTPTTSGPPRRVAEWTPDLPADAPPLVSYRHALCGIVTAPPLVAVRERVPRFVETSNLIGRLGVAGLEEGGDARKALAEVGAFYERFPRSSSATYLYGTFFQIVGACDKALPFFDETLTLQPAHERALLSRTVCLTHLKRHLDAIAAATLMIDTPNVSDAFYWRAWNYRALVRLSDARTDIERAKQLRASGNISTLAGMIEHDQDDLGPAEKDLRTALSMSGGDRNCEAGWYLGSIFTKKQAWRDAAGWFVVSMGCYEERLRTAEAARRVMAARDQVDPDFKARQLAGFDEQIRESRKQRAASAYNAASFYAQVGDLDQARPLIDVAAGDPEIAAEMAALRKFVSGR